MSQQTLFISDLHLDPSQPQITHVFFEFLKHWAPQADALYILGDFFEVWIGDDNHTPFNDSIQQALKHLTATGMPVYLMPGNRDFLLGKKFARETGCQLLPDPTLIDLYGTPTLLLHGDSLCSEDINHQRFRRFSRHPVIQTLFLTVPLWLRRKIARKLRQISSQRTRTISNDMMDVSLTTVAKMMRQYQTARLIHGHTHRPQIHAMDLNGQLAQRIVLGAWHDAGSVLVCAPNKPPTLVEIHI